MAHRQRSLTRLVLAAVTVVGVAAGWLALNEPAGVRVDNGSRLSIAGITWGKTHRIVAGTWWQRLLLQLWPAAGAFGGRAASLTTQDNRLGVWIRKQDGPPMSAGLYSSPGGSNAFDLVDEHGCSFHCEPADEFSDQPHRPLFGPSRQALPLSGSDGLLSVQAAVFPRRTGHADLVLRPTFEGFPLVGEPESARFRIQVPPAARHLAELGAPEPFPIQRRVADTEFVITGIGLVFPWWGTLAPGAPRPRPNDPRWSAPELRFRTRKNGRPTREWQPVGLAVSDGVGNRRVTDIYFTGENGGKAEFNGLCRHDPAWKYELELVRSPETRARPDRTWKVRIPVPAAGQSKDLRFPYHKDGIALSVETVAGPGRVRAPDGTFARYSRPTLHVEFATHSRIALVALNVRPKGRQHSIRAPVDGGNGAEPAFTARTETGWTSAVYLLPLPKGTRWAEAELAIYRTRMITFLAKPPR